MPRLTTDAVIQRHIRPDVRAMHAYAVQPSDGLVKLDAMENPFRLPEPLRTALGARLAEVAINRYPSSRSDDLRRALAQHAGLPDRFDLILGNGSDELISMLSMACANPGASVVAPVPGFVMYDVSARLQGLRSISVPLTPDFELDEAAMLSAMAEHQPAIVYIAYPNNPTANLFDDAIIERLIEAAPGLVVIDEAYQPFASRSYIGRLARHGHVLIMRTLSKFGLAGVRLGYLMGPKALIAEIDKVRPPYNVSVLNCEAALFALEHADEFDRQAAVLRSERARLMSALQALPGVHPYPSEANMILARVPDATTLFAALRQRGILVKNVSNLHPLLANCLRLTVGTPEENALLMTALTSALEASPR
ncbi:MAG: histidinol-phosphate transaminase [Burkholderiales bacterium PBB1]|nr:MAG: histidinol-phosphate transaminase [Burkholderiales bacterium PBB1]